MRRSNVDIDRATTNGDDGTEEAEKKGGRGCLFWVIVLLILQAVARPRPAGGFHYFP